MPRTDAVLSLTGKGQEIFIPVRKTCRCCRNDPCVSAFKNKKGLTLFHQVIKAMLKTENASPGVVSETVLMLKRENPTGKQPEK
jgi:hypothetical protein